MSANMDPESRVALAEIKGDVKLILAGQERTHADVQSINARLDRHDSRLGALETDRSRREGERQGLGLIVKGGYLLGGTTTEAPTFNFSVMSGQNS